MTAELLTLKIQLNSCAREIVNLQKQLGDLKTQSANNEKILTDELANLTRQLEERETLYATLSTQLTDLQNYLDRLKTERDVLIVVSIGAGAAAIGFLIAFLAK